MHNLLKDFTHESYDLKELYKKKKKKREKRNQNCGKNFLDVSFILTICEGVPSDGIWLIINLEHHQYVTRSIVPIKRFGIIRTFVIKV